LDEKNRNNGTVAGSAIFQISWKTLRKVVAYKN
jgi:hypothetical protein